ncbi:MAG: hypothetical protein ACREV4_05405 [Gammaproteobacteria bacterium]
MPLGTHYKEGAEYKIDIGTDLIIKGRVLAMPNCTPIAHARIEHWQADVQGHYVDKLRAYLLSDKDGGFSFKTEWPGYLSTVPLKAGRSSHRTALAD